MASLQFVQIVNGYPTLDIGKLRHYVIILGTAVTDTPQFDEGGTVVAQEEFARGWAAIDAVKGTDVIRGGQTTTQLFLTVAMWWIPGTLPNMSVQHSNGSVYRIQSVENVLEMDIVMILNCIALGRNE